MSEAQRIAALVPTFDNARTLAGVVEGTLRMLPDVLVIDDGSTDGSREILTPFEGRIRLLRHERNFGKGRALRGGFGALAAAGFTHAITLDADGQHFPEDIPAFVEAIRREPGAIHVGERDMLSAGAPKKSRLGLWFSNAALRRLGSASLKDSQCGFRAYPLREVAALGLQGERYDLELEVLLKAARAGMALRPVPIRVTYAPEGGRVSHFRPLVDFIRIALRTAKVLMGSRR